VLCEEELLKDEPDPARAQRGEPLVGRSSVPITCKSVVLPDPEGPTIATSSPRVTVRLTPRSAATGGCWP
jgi:hypothetical protein